MQPFRVNALLPQPQWGRLRRTTVRAALPLGIGAAIVQALAGAGAAVAINYRLGMQVRAGSVL
jgi:hypothetical protein